jgi:hypothetical protein
MPVIFTVTNRFKWDDELEMWLPNPIKPPTPCEAQVCAIIKPDREGYSEWFSVSELTKMLPNCRSLGGSNGSSMFTRELAKDFLFSPSQAFKRQGSRIVERRAYGLVKPRPEKFFIRADIRKKIRATYCAVLGTKSLLEVNHKDGRKDSWVVNDPETQSIEDFQALHKTVNAVKREACVVCKDTNRRFDARHLGFSFGWTEGDAPYQGTCKGCYWYDPKAFRAKVRL